MAEAMVAPAGAAAAAAKPRVLHIFGSLGIGGIENWLMHMFRHQDQFSVRHEVLLTKDEVGVYEAEVRRLGIPVHRLPLARGKLNLLRYPPKLRRFLEENGPYAAVHSHLSLPNGVILAGAKAAGASVRISHCHDARSKGVDFQKPHHRLMRAVSLAAMRRTATDWLGISEAAIEEIAGGDWRRNERARVLLYGFDFGGAAGAAARARKLRAALGIGRDAPVIGHVGRFDPVKNHALILDSFAILKRRVPEAQLVLVGEGPLLEQVRRRAVELGLGGSVHLPGPTHDAPAYMAMFDLLVLPSFSEGLGIVCLEAQAAGTRSLVSEKVPSEAAIVEGGVERLPLSAGAKGWAGAVERMIGLPKPDAERWRGQVEESRFGIRRCIEELDSIYQAAIGRTA